MELPCDDTSINCTPWSSCKGGKGVGQECTNSALLNTNSCNEEVCPDYRDDCSYNCEAMEEYMKYKRSKKLKN